MRILNLYGSIDGREDWEDSHKTTALTHGNIDEYKKLFPTDEIINIKANLPYIRDSLKSDRFDFIWISKPFLVYEEEYADYVALKGLDEQLMHIIRYLETFAQIPYTVRSLKLPTPSLIYEPKLVLDGYYYWSNFGIVPHYFDNIINSILYGATKYLEMKECTE